MKIALEFPEALSDEELEQIGASRSMRVGVRSAKR